MCFQESTGMKRSSVNARSTINQTTQKIESINPKRNTERGVDMFPMKYWTDTFAREEIMREKTERRFRFIKKI